MCLVAAVGANAQNGSDAQQQTNKDPASILAEILAGKGAISPAELASVENAAMQDRVAVLARLLRAKGVLDSADLARLSVPSEAGQTSQLAQAGPSSAPAASPTPVAPSSPNAPSVPAQAMPAEHAEANGGKHIPLTIYGTALFNAGLNTAGVNLEDAGSIVAKPGSSVTANRASYFETPRQTRVGVRLDPTTVAGAQLTGAVEVDAYSASAPFPDGANMGLFRLRLAYGRLDWQNFAIEIGQDWSIFAPLNPASLAMYAVAEFNGSGNPWARLPQLRIEAKDTLNAKNRLLYQLAFSDPDDGDYVATFTGARPPGAGELGHVPAVESRLAWSSSGENGDYMLGFSGRYGRGKNIGTLNNATVVQAVDSWGAAVDYTLPFSKLFNLTGEAYIGRALGLYDVALGESVGTLGTPGGHGILSRGGWVQAQFNTTKRSQWNFGYGIDNPSAHDLAVGSRDRNANLFGNFIFKLTSNVQFSLEYRRLLTYYEDQAWLTGRANQFTMSGAYIF